MGARLRKVHDSQLDVDPDAPDDCFLCGRRVRSDDPHRGTYGIAIGPTGQTGPPDEQEWRPLGPQLKIHVPCLEGRDVTHVEVAYRTLCVEMAKAQVGRLR